MWSICSSLQSMIIPPLKHNSKLLFHHSKSIQFKKSHHLIIINSFSKDDSPNKIQLGYDPSDEIFDLDVNIPPRDAKSNSDAMEPRSWFGPNGQYIKEFPCPSCRGRGYTPCAECGIERSRQDCSLCSGKGIMTCQQCLGECVIWKESIDEIPWEKAHSNSPFKVKEDDEVDNLELKLDSRKKSKRVYRSTPPEVGLKISRSLKSLNAKTGLFSKSMKIIHRDPALHAQRVAAIKKAKGTPAARKHASETLKTFFSDPENRRKRSISMKGARFFCKNCGQEGHRRHYCPELGENTEMRFKCRLCGEKGHNRRTCQKPRTSKPKLKILREYRCWSCGKGGHNSRTCSQKAKLQSDGVSHENKGSVNTKKGVPKHRRCRVCGKFGHNSRTCSLKNNHLSDSITPETEGSLNDSKIYVRDHNRHCSVCGKVGHNSRTCSQKSKLQSDGAADENKGSVNTKRNVPKNHRQCSVCGKFGHNCRTCSLKTNHQSDSITPETEGTLNDSKKYVRHENRHCSVCGKNGHNSRTCSVRNDLQSDSDRDTSKSKGSSKDSMRYVRKNNRRCSLCGIRGHNSRTCSLKTELQSQNASLKNTGSLKDSKGNFQKHRHCSLCGKSGHNKRTCSGNSIEEFDMISGLSRRMMRPYY